MHVVARATAFAPPGAGRLGGTGGARPLSAPVARVGACGAMAAFDEKLYTPALVKEVQMLIDQGMRTGQVSGSWHKIKSEFTAAKVGWYGRVSPF